MRLLIAGLAAFGVMSLLTSAPYWLAVVLTFCAAAVAAGILREFFTPSPRPLGDLFPDLVIPLVLAGLMLLAVRALAPSQQPTPVVPALVWPFVDLWRPLRGRGSH